MSSSRSACHSLIPLPPPSFHHRSLLTPFSQVQAMSLATLLLLLLLLATAAAATGETNFTFNGFIGSNLTLSGAAEITDKGLLRLTNDTKEQLGHAFYRFPVRVKTGGSSSSSNSSAHSFSTTFVFAIVPQHKVTFGHGIAFALSQTSDIPGSKPSQYLGLFNSTNRDKPADHIVAVEFDTVQNYDVGDIDDNHVGIDINELRSRQVKSAGYYDQHGDLKNISLVSGESLQVWIEYDGFKKDMSVTISPLAVSKPTVPLLDFYIDLSSALLADMFVGFSSSTGAATAVHYVLGWSFCLNGEATPLDHSKLPNAPKPPKKVSSAVVIGLPVVATIVVVHLISWLVIVVVRRRRKFAEILEDWEVAYGPHRFSYKDLYKATDGFNDRNILGAGGFGLVYRGLLRTPRMEVAVKKVSHNSRQGMKEFVAEIVSMGRLRHRNLVQLLGYCRREGELLLVYDYMANGSLDKFLFSSEDTVDENGALVLNWTERFRIIKGVAAGLLYLHEGWEQVVIHRDIKASNVLLDDDMNGKLSDFGLARLYDHGSNPQTTRIVGTVGYLAPEQMKTSKATTATDVYAFGIFLLEVVCGRRPMQMRPASDEGQILVDWVLDCWHRGDLMKVVDAKMRGHNPPAEVETVLRLGLLCSHLDADSRPIIRQVVQILEGEAPMPVATPGNLSASSLAIRRREGFEEFVMSYPYMTDTTTSESVGGSSSSAKVSLPSTK